jgi:hypothetical protein
VESPVPPEFAIARRDAPTTGIVESHLQLRNVSMKKVVDRTAERAAGEQSTGNENCDADIVTIMRSQHFPLAKRIYADGRVEPYANARTFDLFEYIVPDLDALHALLMRLQSRPDCAVVFGGILDRSRAQLVRRLAYPDPDTGDEPTLRPIPHRWCALDLDQVPRPETVSVDDLLACAIFAVRRLPVAFHGVRCIVQATASHGIKPGCRLRIWYWLNKPTTGDELAFWLRDTPVDPCTFRTAHPIYTASPIFIDQRDHLPTRIVAVPGAAAVQVPSVERPPAPNGTSPSSSALRAVSDAEIEPFIDRVLNRLRNAPDGEKHNTLRKCARLLGGVQAQADLSDKDIIVRLVDALPASAIDLRAAARTAAWGLASGRQAPITVNARANPGASADDPRRRETARLCFRLLQTGIPSTPLLRYLHKHNSGRSNPLPPGAITEIAFWAVRHGR